MDKPRIGFIGLGMMGHGMAANLARKGFPLAVKVNRDRSRLADILAAGARECANNAEVAANADFVILCVTGSLLAFEQFYILTKGGPDNSTITVVQLIYSVAFQGQNDLGVAAALSVIVLAALVVINVVQLRAFRGSDES